MRRDVSDLQVREILKSEFDERIKRIQIQLVAKGLDALLVYGDEKEPQNVRYLADFWPAFEKAGVVVPIEGEPILIIGPESEDFARGWSKIDKIRKVLDFRESAEPEYPEIPACTVREILEEALGAPRAEKLGLVGYNLIPVSLYEKVRKDIGKTEIVRADDILINMRMIKSESEIKLLQESYKLAALGIEKALERIKPGMTEIQVIAEAEYAMKTNGAEDLGYNLWCVTGSNTTHAIARPSYRTVREDEIIQLDVGAKVGGYSSSISRPLAIGKIPSHAKSLIKVALETEQETISLVKPGVVAKDVANKIRESITSKGYGKYIVYGPCHGTGLVECEPPWVETTSNWEFTENMVFCVDIFLKGPDIGVRFEDGIRVTRHGAEKLFDYSAQVLCL